MQESRAFTDPVAAAVPAASAAHAAWDRFLESFLESYFEAQPVFAASSGRHEFDGRLPDWSREALEGEAARLQAERRHAEAFDPAALDEPRRFERDYVLAQIDCDLFWLVEAEWPYRNPLFYSGALDPSLYTTRPYAPLEDRLRAYVGYARHVPRAASQIRANFRTPLPRTYAELGAMSFGGLADYYERDAVAAFAAVKDARLHDELREANAAAAAAMRDLGAWLKAQAGVHANRRAEADGFRLGPSRFLRMLSETERVDVSLDDLEAAGRRELERNLEALREACAAYAPGTPVAECLARVQAEKPEGGPVAGARRQLAGLRRFVEEHGLVSIPGSEDALIEEAPPYQRWNAAFIDIPGVYDSHLPSIYYISPPDPAWSAEERDAYLPGEADLLFITAHEVWPGHFLQFLHAHQVSSLMGRLFIGYGFAEGWAHYSEELMWEAGFGQGDPGTRIGQLQNALLRNVRYLVAIGLHAGDLTLEEAERMFREQAFQDSANARQQAARGSFDPAYLNYTMGKLMVRKLRDDWTAPRGGRRAWRDFHDCFLSYGGPPIPLVRRAMLAGTGGELF